MQAQARASRGDPHTGDLPEWSEEPGEGALRGPRALLSVGHVGGALAQAADTLGPLERSEDRCPCVVTRELPTWINHS